MGFHAQPVTVAVADANRNRRIGCERFLQDKLGIELLEKPHSSDDSNNDYAFTDRRRKPRTNLTPNEDEVARITRLNPLVLLVNLNLCDDDDYALLLSLRYECPDVLLILMADDSVHESRILHALEIGARGYLKQNTLQIYLSKALQVVSRGEAWVPRKMMGNMIRQVFNSQASQSVN